MNDATNANDLVRVPDSGPRELYRHATDVAGVCGEIVKRTSKRIGNRDHVSVEGWQAIATTHGCMLSVEEVRESPEGDVSAVAAVRRMSDGQILSRAEGFVGMDEKTWAARQRYARRAMAQTRAMSRVARAAFAHVVLLIDKNLATTPAEEMGYAEEPAPAQFRQPPRKQVPSKPAEQTTAASGDRLADDATFASEVQEALDRRGFDEAARWAVYAAAARKKGKAKLMELELADRHGLLAAIGDGKFDKLKREPAGAA